MVFIDKTTTHSNESKARLEAWKVGFLHEGKTLEVLYAEADQTGAELWVMLNQDVKDRLRDDLNLEQEDICCYCCQFLLLRAIKIEHFLVKSAPDCVGEAKVRAFAQRVFNYDNLLLSCDGGESSQKPYEVKRKANGQLETKEDIAFRLDVTTELLDKLNPPNTTIYSLGAKIKYTEGVHCDTKKGNNPMPIINPTTHLYCWQYFEVDRDGTIKVNSEIANEALRELVQNTITILNLEEPRLKARRKIAWQKFEDTLTEEEEFKETFPDRDKLYAYLQGYFTLQIQIKAPFCFVNYHFIQDFIQSYQP